MAKKYEVRIREKNPDGSVGKIVGRFGKYPTKKAAKTDAQRLADKRVFNPATQITVEPVQGSPRSRSAALAKSAAIAKATRRRNPKRKRNPVRRRRTSFTEPSTDNDRLWAPTKNPRRKTKKRRINPTTWTFLGHKVVGKHGDWTILPYGKRLTSKEAVRKWLRRHVKSSR